MEFLKNKREEMRVHLDPQSVIRDWLAQQDALYAQIRYWLTQPEREGLIRIRDEQKEVQEEPLGRYEAPVLFLETDWETLRVEPVARIVNGAMGRIDMHTKNQRFILLQNAEQHWYYRREGATHSEGKLYELTFERLLKELLA